MHANDPFLHSITLKCLHQGVMEAATPSGCRSTSWRRSGCTVCRTSPSTRRHSSANHSMLATLQDHAGCGGSCGCTTTNKLGLGRLNLAAGQHCCWPVLACCQCEVQTIRCKKPAKAGYDWSQVRVWSVLAMSADRHARMVRLMGERQV